MPTLAAFIFQVFKVILFAFMLKRTV